MNDSNSIFKRKKVLFVTNGGLIASRGYNLYYRSAKGDNWAYYGRIKDGYNSVLASFALLRRLMRAEISKLYLLNSGTELCVARKGIFRRCVKGKDFEKTFVVLRGSRPMFLCEDVDGAVYFDEYFQNMEKKAVHVYGSNDDGKTWRIVRTFSDGNINHIHGIYRDPYTKALWLATGDRDKECIIGFTNDGFKSFTEVFRGGQEYRTCVLFFYKDFIVFGTDSQYQQNGLKMFDRNTLEIKHLQDVQGPVIRGTQFGDISMISTDVEPSEVNKDPNAYVWITKDGLHWEELCHAKKDILPAMLFQFGVFDLPMYSSDYGGAKVYVTGKAVSGCNGDTLSFDI